MKKPLLSIPEEYPNLDIIGNVRADSVLYDLPPERTGRKGRPAGHGKQLSIETDFIFSDEKIDGYFIAVRPVITNLFGSRKVLAYITDPEPGSGKKKLFFSTVFPEQLQIFSAWQEKAPLNRTGSSWMKYIPLFFYGFRWNIETSYYEQKTFWSLCSYMVRNRSGIERMVNLSNISYYAMKILPYQATDIFCRFRENSRKRYKITTYPQSFKTIDLPSGISSIKWCIFILSCLKPVSCYIPDI